MSVKELLYKIVSSISNLASSQKEELSEIKVILMKNIENGKVIGLYNMNLKYYCSFKTSKGKMRYLIVSLNSIKQTFTLVVYLY